MATPDKPLVAPAPLHERAYVLGARSVRSRGGWLIALCCAAASFSLLCFATSLDLGMFLTIGFVVGAVVVGIFTAFYTALWRGEIPWRRSGPPLLAALVWTVAISALGVSVFAPLTFRLYNAGHLSVSAGIEDAPHHAHALATSWDFAVAYLWQLCNALPALEVTDTVDWNQPLEHGTRMGLLLLAFRAVVLVPLFASLVGIWSSRPTATALAPQAPRREADARPPTAAATDVQAADVTEEGSHDASS